MAWLSAYRFARRPATFVGLDDVVFKKPVEVGRLRVRVRVRTLPLPLPLPLTLTLAPTLTLTLTLINQGAAGAQR